MLNLLAGSEWANSCYHLTYNPATRAWSKKATLPFAPSQYSAFLVRDKSIHIGAVEKKWVTYLAYDGEKWEGPIRIEESEGALRVRMTLDREGSAHLAWWTPEPDEHGYTVINNEKTVSGRQMFKDRPVLRDEFDLGLSPKGEILIAYQASLPDDHADRDAIHIRRYSGGRWSEPLLLGGTSGLCLGGVRLVSGQSKVFLTWLHRADYTDKSMFVSGPVRSFVVGDAQEWTQPKPACQLQGRGFRSGGFMGDHFCGLHLDSKAMVHMAWGSGCQYHHAVVTRLDQ